MKVGELVAGRYELEELVGEGGMSSVYRAHDRVLERRVALKVLHEHYSRDPEYVERFRREARAIARLTHPHVVTVIDRGSWEGRQFIVFEHVPGENLKDVVAREGALPLPRALALGIEIAQALAYAHELGIVHRDVKPQNVLLDPGGAAKVTDFGIARALDVDDGLTTTGTVLGTGHYLSPEQASGERADERSDQYSFGVLLYELLTGSVPYPGESLMAVAMRHVRDPVPSVRAARPDVPPSVEAAVARMLAKRPADRFPSMAEVVAALEACRDEAPSAPAPGEETGVLPAPPRPSAPRVPPTPARPAPVRPRRRPPPPRARAVAVLAAAVLAVVVALLAVELARDDGLPGIGELPGVGDAGGGEGRVPLRAVSDYDPEGDETEHPEAVPRATDGDAATYWTTETYRTFSKPGVGIVLDARRPRELSRLVVTSDEPGFTALVLAGDAAGGPFEEVSEEGEIGRRAELELDTGGTARRFYVLWITDPNGRAHVNEVTAFASG